MSAGVPVLLLHGLSLNAGMWADQVARLGTRARVLAPDLPGFGGTPAPEEPSMDGYAVAVRELLDAEGIDRCLLVGFSLGGYVALAFLRAWPERLAGLLLAGTRADPDGPAERDWRTGLQRRWREEGDALDEAWLRRLVAPDAPSGTLARVRGLLDRSAPGAIAALEAMKWRREGFTALREHALPVLAVAGEHDASVPVAAAHEIHAHAPRSRVEVVPGAGHLVNVEAPERFDDLLAGFAAEIREAGAC